MAVLVAFILVAILEVGACLAASWYSNPFILPAAFAVMPVVLLIGTIVQSML